MSCRLRLLLQRLPPFLMSLSRPVLLLPYLPVPPPPLPVPAARVMTDRETNKPRGFAFVTFENAKDADDAIAGLNETVRLLYFPGFFPLNLRVANPASWGPIS